MLQPGVMFVRRIPLCACIGFAWFGASACAQDSTEGSAGGAGGQSAEAPVVEPDMTSGRGGETSGMPDGAAGAPRGGEQAVPPPAKPVEMDASVPEGGAGPEPVPSGDASVGGAAPVPVLGGSALMVVGTIPLRGTDVQISQAIEEKGIDVETILEKDVTVPDAEDRRVVVLSYSMQSGELGADLADVSSSLFVLEHNLLDRLGMTAGGDGHGFQQGLTRIEIISDDPLLTAGFPQGPVTVYDPMQEMFWGVPGPGAIQVAHIDGNPNRVTYFAYPAGAMMVGRTAPGKRMQFFYATHAPPPVDTLYLNDNGLRLLSAALEWCVQ